MESEPYNAVLRVSPERLQPQANFAPGHRVAPLNIGPVDPSSLEPAACAGTTRFQMLPRLTVSRHALAGHQLASIPIPPCHADDRLTLVICVEGRGDAVFGEREVSLGAGQALLLPHGDRLETVTGRDTVILSIRLDCDAVSDVFPPFDNALLHPTRPNTSALKLLVGYCEQLLSVDDIPDSLARLCSSQIRDLIAHLYDPASELPCITAPGGVKAIRLRCVLREIHRGFRDPNLSAAAVGSRLGLTGRYVQQLLEAAGLSFSEHVRNLRIDEAKRLLRQPRDAHRHISHIAYEVGFRDLSYFNREFRRRTSRTPSQVRRQA